MLHPRALAPLLLAFGVAVIAFACLNHVNPVGFPINDDSIRDQLLARDCVELGHCYLIGAPTSVPGFHQGAVWPDLLVAVRLMGGDESTARTVVLALLALSVGTLFLTVWQWLLPSLAFPAALCLLGALSVDEYPSTLVNPSTSAFFDVLTAAGLLCYGLSGAPRFLLVAAFVLGLAINVHIGALSLIPALLAVAIVGRQRPLRQVLAALGMVAGTYVVTSPAALLANYDGLVDRGRLLPAVGGALCVMLLAAGLGPWFRRRSWNVRAWLVGGALVLPFSLGAWWLVVVQQHAFGLSYLHPVLGPAAVLAAALVSIPFELVARGGGGRVGWVRWLPTAASAAGLGALGVVALQGPGAARAEPWTLTDGSAIARLAANKGWTYDELPFRIQSSACRELLAAMSVAAPRRREASDKGRKQLQVLLPTRDELVHLVGPHDEVALRRGQVAVVREIDSWLQPQKLVACRRPPGAPPVCTAAHRTAVANTGAFLFLKRSFPEIHGLDLPAPYLATYEIPLAPLAGERRDLTLADHGSVAECDWRITRVEGVEVESPLPGLQVRLSSATGRPGLLVIEKLFGSAPCTDDVVDRRYPPCILETLPQDASQFAAEAP